MLKAFLCTFVNLQHIKQKRWITTRLFFYSDWWPYGKNVAVVFLGRFVQPWVQGCSKEWSWVKCSNVTIIPQDETLFLTVFVSKQLLVLRLTSAEQPDIFSCPHGTIQVANLLQNMLIRQTYNCTLMEKKKSSSPQNFTIIQSFQNWHIKKGHKQHISTNTLSILSQPHKEEKSKQEIYSAL